MARRAPPGDETPPWLEPVARGEEEHTLVSWRTLIIGAALALALAVGLVLGVRALIARDRAEPELMSAAEVPIITAPDEPYKVRPDDPGGVQLEGVDQTIYAAGEGVDPDGRIDLSGLPEEPVPPGEPVDLIAQTLPPEGEALDAAEAGEPLEGAVARARSVAPAGAQGAVAPAPGAPSPAASPPAPAAGGAAVQLGAFSSRAKADAAWKSFTGRFAYLDGLEKEIEATRREGETLYRLRAGGIADRRQAQALCARLKVAGETCMVAE